MSRSGYDDCIDDPLMLGQWRGQVASATRGKRGQAFLKELAAAMDAMPVKEIIKHELIDPQGQVCTIGVVCKSRGIDVSGIDIEDPEMVGNAVGIARPLAAEIEYLNDENDSTYDHSTGGFVYETPAQRWKRMRKWVDEQIVRKDGE
jgi:hypothetical protein